jgi:hypothetical protein
MATGILSADRQHLTGNGLLVGDWAGFLFVPDSLMMVSFHVVARSLFPLLFLIV